MEEFLEPRIAKFLIMFFSIIIMVVIFFIGSGIPQPEGGMILLMPASLILFTLPVLVYYGVLILSDSLFLSESVIPLAIAATFAIVAWYIQTCFIYWIFKKFAGYRFVEREVDSQQEIIKWDTQRKFSEPPTE